MKLTLGQAAKETGISKPSLSAAIKKGRLSAYKNESGTYEIDPAELFRVYPPKANPNGVSESHQLPPANPSKDQGNTHPSQVEALLLAERDKLIAEKDKSIERLEQEKSQVREDLDDQREQTKRMTLLLEDRSGGSEQWKTAIEALEKRIANQEENAVRYKEKARKILRQNRALKARNEELQKPLLRKVLDLFSAHQNRTGTQSNTTH